MWVSWIIAYFYTKVTALIRVYKQLINTVEKL